MQQSFLIGRGTTRFKQQRDAVPALLSAYGLTKVHALQLFAAWHAKLQSAALGFQKAISMSRPIYPALVGEVARLGRSKTGDNQQRDDQRHEAGSSHEGTSRLMIEITCSKSSPGAGFTRPCTIIYVCYRITNTGTLPSARTSDVWLPNHSFLRPRRP